MSFLKRLFAGKDATAEASASVDPAPQARQYTGQELSFLEEQATNLMRQVNESVQLAHNSTKPDTKVSRLEFCKARLEQLQALAVEHPRITITNLDAMLQTIARLEGEFSAAGYYAQSDAVDANFRAQALQSCELDGSMAKWEFSAVLQLRTPLHILQMHGDIIDGPPTSTEAVKLHQGSWHPVPRSWKEQTGLDIPDFPRSMASDVGTIPSDGGTYLKFLIQVRRVVEADAPAGERLKALRVEVMRPEWRQFCVKLGGNEAVYSRFFPKFLDTIPGLAGPSRRILWEKGLVTPSALDDTPDAELLATKGVGPAKLKIIRAACSAAADPQSDIVDAVGR